MKRILFLALLAPAALAHDFWIEPSTFHPQVGKTFTAALRVGEDFEGDPVPRRSSRIESFVVRDAAGERSVNGFENQDPAGFVRIDAAGGAVIGYRGKPNPHQLPSAKFAKFLEEEGVRGLAPKGDRVQRERFHRFAKSLVGGDVAAAPLGFRFELVALGGSRFQLLYEGKPIAGMQVSAVSREGEKLSARTDANGTVTLAIKKGVWLVKSVHVLPAPKGADYDWDSLWASLTLEI